MAIDWRLIKDTAQSLIADLSGVSVRWRDEVREPVYGYQPTIYLRASSVRQVGVEEEFLTAPDSIDDQIVTLVGQRMFTLSIRCEASTTDIASVNHPAGVLERVAVRLRRTSTAQRLRDADAFAIATVENIAYSPYFEQGRHVEVYILDVQCNTVDVDVDTTLDSGGFVDEVKINSGSVKEPADASTLGTVVLDVDTGPSDTDP